MSVSYDINSVLHTTMSKLRCEYAASQDLPYKMGVVYDISSSVQPAKTQADVVIAHHHVMHDVLATMLVDHTQMHKPPQTEHSQIRVPACIV